MLADCSLTTCARADAGASFNYPFLTSYERDNETGLDFAQARYYGNAQGRFTSPDPLTASMRPINPQSFNRYTYVSNNPLKFTDPSGLRAQYDASRNGWSDEAEPGMNQSELEHQQRVNAPRDVSANANLQVVSQNQGTILIIVGDPGLRRHNAGRNLDRVAQTKKEELEAQGYTVIVQRASSFEDFANALTNNGTLDGVEYVGHASNIMLFVGEQPVPGTNVDHSNISQLSNANLSSTAYIKLNGCDASTGGSLSIGQWLANRLDRTVFAFDGPSHFYGSANPVRVAPRPGDRPPETGPLYLLEDRGTRLIAIRPG